MPMPRKHVKQMHEMAEVISAYGELSNAKNLISIAQIMNDPKFKTALDEFHDNAESRKLASKNATTYWKRKGVKVPKGISLTLKDNNWRVSACGKVQLEINGIAVAVEVGAHYDSESGWAGDAKANSFREKRPANDSGVFLLLHKGSSLRHCSHCLRRDFPSSPP